MQTFKDWFEQTYNEQYPKGDVINAEWFFERNLPMIVECSCCTTTMALPNALIDEEGNIYCSSCGGNE